MRKIISLIHVSLDGYVAGPNGEMDWIVYNAEIEQIGHALHASTDAAIYGRVTYQMMEGYWPGVLNDPTADAGARAHAEWLDTATKVVFSKTLDNVTWKNTLLIHDNVAEAVNKLKNQPGKDMWFLGSPTLSQTFMELNLIDEYRFNISPVVLGAGKPLFKPGFKANLNLIEAKTYPGGVVAVRYELASK